MTDFDRFLTDFLTAAYGMEGTHSSLLVGKRPCLLLLVPVVYLFNDNLDMASNLPLNYILKWIRFIYETFLCM